MVLIKIHEKKLGPPVNSQMYISQQKKVGFAYFAGYITTFPCQECFAQNSSQRGYHEQFPLNSISANRSASFIFVGPGCEDCGGQLSAQFGHNSLLLNHNSIEIGRK